MIGVTIAALCLLLARLQAGAHHGWITLGLVVAGMVALGLAPYLDYRVPEPLRGWISAAKGGRGSS